MGRTELLLSISDVRQVLSGISLPDKKDRQPILDKIEELEDLVRKTNFGL